MSRHRIHICLLLMALAVTNVAHGSDIGEVVMPKADAFLPLPPDSASVGFALDFYKWIWGKKQRETYIGEQASLDSGCDIERLCQIYGGILDIDINPSNTPAIFSLMNSSAQAGIFSCRIDNPRYMRNRPFVMMNEQPWGENDINASLSDSTSFPSAHAAMVWSTALALSQMAPQLQDTILSRAMKCASSGVITGSEWQSDVEAGLMCASAAMARNHAASQFASLMEQARNEYLQLSGLSESDLNALYPSIENILGTPPSIDDIFFVDDLEKYWYFLSLQNSERGDLAKADCSMDDNYIIDMFDACSPVVTISEQETPQIISFVKVLKFMLSKQATALKTSTFRKRPYIQFKEDIPYGGEAWHLYTESSYPSRHAFIGWGLALALVEVMPDCQDALLKRGYEYGDSRLYLGMCYASDVKASRVMAACNLNKLHNETFYKVLLENAKKEYQQRRYDVNGDGLISSIDVTALYNYLLNGDDSAIVNGDLDGDGVISSVDVTIVYNILLGE